MNTTSKNAALLAAVLMLPLLILAGCSSRGSFTPTAQAQQMTITTPAILSGYCDNGPTTSFMIGLGSTSGCLSNGSAMGLPIPSGGSLRNLRVNGLANGELVTVLINGISSGITCTLPVTPSTFGNCSDTTHTTTVAAGDLVAVEASSINGSPVQFIQVALEKQ